MSTTEIERRPLTPLDATATRRAITQYQEGLKSLLDPAEDVQMFRSRDGSKHAFVKRSGWRKIALWCDLSVENRTVEVDRDEAGRPLRARVVARASAPNGRFADGEGSCAANERSFSKLEHDLLATAATRAVNRAISNLVGLGAVSAEEMDGAVTPMAVDTEHPYGPDATDELVGEALTAIRAMWPDMAGDAEAMVDLLTRNFGSFPEIAGRTIKGLHYCVTNPPKPAAPPSHPAFEEVVTPAAEEITTPTVENTPANSTSGVANADDEVDIDAIFDAEAKFME
jgi:hypothetical protein